ncbi:hypothetical protein COO60DRAFT_1018542 [Scenedesmus sp. NREL 46B-D3]|nr:hypothetical protein COO60DRAFT_1018542 [Scenedesmus sp. NREL 46B-D3]
MAAFTGICTTSAGAVFSSTEGQEGGCLLELLPLSCWSAVVDLLSARDLLSLSLSTKAVQQLLNSTPGIWCQAVCNCLLACAAAGTSSSNRTASRAVAGVSGASGNSSNHWHTRQQQQAAAAAAPTGSSTSDEAAHHMLSATTALAYSCQRLKPQMKPQCYLLPPWLAAQPGKARGLVRAEQVQTLNPALMLSQAQVHWLSLGCLSGHDGGVFTSSCSSSPRSRAPCGFMAAVVISKALVAELYLPPSCKAPDRWAGISSPPVAAAAAQSNPGAVTAELWLSTVVSLEHPAAATDASFDRSSSSRGRQRRPTGKSRGVAWYDVHALLMRCIAGNAARARAVQGTCVVPPGTAAAADVEARLAQLVAAGAPVLDVRRLLQCSLEPVPYHHQQQQQQQQQHSSSSSSSSTRELDDDATAEAVAALVQQLPRTVPQVQLLVLPVVLPGGRVGQRLPGGRGGGGSRLSAPRLLSLNVPFLVPVRHAWEQLPCLRQVLLMVGPPAPLPAVQQQQQQQQQNETAGFGLLRRSSGGQPYGPQAGGLAGGVADDHATIKHLACWDLL